MNGKKKSWWGRNWIWMVSVGCLGMIVIVVGLLAVLIGIGLKIVKSSTPYVQAVAAAKADPRVIAALGSPINEGWFFNGNVTESSNWSSGAGSTSSGSANLKISIHGPKGEGTIHVVGTMSGGKWVFSILSVTIKATGQSIDLKEKSKKSGRLENHRGRDFICEAAFYPADA